MKTNEMINKKFGKITVLGDSGRRASNGGIILDAVCDCGKSFQVQKSNLIKKKNPTCTCGSCSRIDESIKNKKFGLLTAIEINQDKTKQMGYTFWNCLCDCGKTTTVSRRNLVTNNVKSCGCLANGNFLAKPGDKFGKLTIVEKIEGKQWYKCQCDCGEIKLIQSNKLKNNTVYSCGNCYKHELENVIINNWKILKQTNETDKGFYYLCKCIKCGNITKKKLNEIKNQKGKFCNFCRLDTNIIGQKIAKLTVLEQFREDKKTYCICKCECGNVKKINKSNLKNGTTKSCGCLKESGGEKQIKNILEENNIIYEVQKTFFDCKSEKGNLLKFDFYLPEFNVLIEYDGQQHFKEIEIFSESLSEIQERDKIKNMWCKDNNIPLIRIPYYEYKKLDINYLLDKITEVR